MCTSLGSCAHPWQLEMRLLEDVSLYHCCHYSLHVCICQPRHHQMGLVSMWSAFNPQEANAGSHHIQLTGGQIISAAERQDERSLRFWHNGTRIKGLTWEGMPCDECFRYIELWQPSKCSYLILDMQSRH